VQIVGYDTSDPGLLVSHASGSGDRDASRPADGTDAAGSDTPAEIEFLALEPGDDLDYALDERHCAGAVTESGHIPCRKSAAPQCPQHRSTWVCAKCTGECLKDEMDCVEPHAVYLAAFAPDVFKVGVTKEWRLETRLREQGADRGARLATVPDGRIARRREAEIAEAITDRVRVPTKRAGLHRSVDADAWADLLSSYDVDDGDRFAFDYGLSTTGSTSGTGPWRRPSPPARSGGPRGGCWSWIVRAPPTRSTSGTSWATRSRRGRRAGTSRRASARGSDSHNSPRRGLNRRKPG